VATLGYEFGLQAAIGAKRVLYLSTPKWTTDLESKHLRRNKEKSRLKKFWDGHVLFQNAQSHELP
jgi:hypothetical protein